MKVKIIGLLLGILMLTGCSATYNLEITEDTFEESFVINANIDNIYTTKESLYDAYLEEYPVYIDQEFMYYDPYTRNENYSYYDKSYQETTEGYMFSYRYIYEADEINRARSIQSSYDSVSFGYIDEEDYHYISLRNPIIFNNNNNLTALTINLSFDNDAVVLSNNADLVNGNTYTWQLNPTNLKDINITYRFLHLTDPDPEPETPENNPSNSDTEQNEEVSNWVNDNKVIVYVGVFVILVCVIIIFSVIKSKKR